MAIYNSILIHFTQALSISEQQLISFFAKGGISVSPSDVRKMLKTPGSPGVINCKTKMMLGFLDGFIQAKRGEMTSSSSAPTQSEQLELSPNSILKKLRVAYKLQDADMLEIFALAKLEMSKSELKGVFRKPEHKSYKAIDEAFLLKFIDGLAAYQNKDKQPNE